MKYLLASASPRRRKLLRLALDAPFEVQASDADEHEEISDPALLVQVLARKKAEAVAKGKKGYLVIGADTVVAFEGKILGKPQSRQHARQMLQMLSGRSHTVYTGIALLSTDTGRVLLEADRTLVTFAPMSPEEIEAYLETGEGEERAEYPAEYRKEMVEKGWMEEPGKWKTGNGGRPECMDKAGAYGIQGGAARHIRGLEGCYFNVMGLPVHRIYELLKRL